MKIVRINIDDTMNELTVKQTKNIVSVLSKHSTSTGTSDFQLLYIWNQGNGETISCYGWYDGNAGSENKHDLIPSGVSDFLEEDSSEKLLFGNIFLVKKIKNKFVDFSVTDYANLYNEMFEGFDECITDEEEEEAEEEPDQDDKDFIINDSDEESDDSYEYKEDEELDFDKNKY
jgi:hypothetical protein